MKFNDTIVLAPVMVAVLALAGCGSSEGPAEQAGKKLDQAVQAFGQKAQAAAATASAAVTSAGEKAGAAVDAAAKQAGEKCGRCHRQGRRAHGREDAGGGQEVGSEEAGGGWNGDWPQGGGRCRSRASARPSAAILSHSTSCAGSISVARLRCQLSSEVTNTSIANRRPIYRMGG